MRAEESETVTGPRKDNQTTRKTQLAFSANQALLRPPRGPSWPRFAEGTAVRMAAAKATEEQTPRQQELQPRAAREERTACDFFKKRERKRQNTNNAGDNRWLRTTDIAHPNPLQVPHTSYNLKTNVTKDENTGTTIETPPDQKHPDFCTKTCTGIGRFHSPRHQMGDTTARASPGHETQPVREASRDADASGAQATVDGAQRSPGAANFCSCTAFGRAWLFNQRLRGVPFHTVAGIKVHNSTVATWHDV